MTAALGDVPLFNSPLETGLRALVVLDAFYPRPCTISELTWFDHLVVHTADVEGPDSLHPDLPSRGGGLLVRRRLIDEGVHLLLNAGLIALVDGADGVRYVAGEEAPSFIELMEASYSSRLKSCAEWLADRIRQSRGQADASLAAFDGIVLTALKEIEQALARSAAAQQQNAALAKAAFAADDAARISHLRFVQGRDNFLTLLVAEQDRASARRALAQSDTKVADAQVSLFKALGGGWENAPSPRKASSDEKDGTPFAKP